MSESSKQRLFQFAVIYNPSGEERKKGAKPGVLVSVTECLATDEQGATLIAARQIPEAYLDRLERIEVAVRCFSSPVAPAGTVARSGMGTTDFPLKEVRSGLGDRPVWQNYELTHRTPAISYGTGTTVAPATYTCAAAVLRPESGTAGEW